MDEQIPKLCTEAYHSSGVLGLARLVADNEDIYNSFKPINKHFNKPEMLKIYEVKSATQKMDFDKQYTDWRHKSGSEAYISGVDSIKLENDSNLSHLRKYHSLLEGDMARQLKILKLINMYTKETDYKEAGEPVKEKVELFGGKVVSTTDWED